MKNPPGIDYVELAQGQNVFVVQNRSLCNGPIAVIREIAAFEFGRACHRMAVIIKRMDAGTQSSRCKAKKTAP
jgi:hypothetical protein